MSRSRVAERRRVGRPGPRVERARTRRARAGSLAWGTLVRRLYDHAVRRRTPLAGTLALTYRCNLSCAHCYLRGSRGGDELSTEQWLDIVRQVRRAGCLWLLLTGGEPLLRRDFARIYLEARRLGLLVTVFTNGLRVDDAVVELWREHPPHEVELSLYGYSRRACGEVTGRPEARDAAFEAARRLVRAGVPLRLKTMALRGNVGELERLRRFAGRLGAPFRFDTDVSPSLRGSAETCRARLDLEAALRLETSDPARMGAWGEFLESRPAVPPRRTLFDCGGGRYSFFVGPDGQLGLCPYDVGVYDLRRGSFAEGWRGPVRARRALPLPADHACRGCSARSFCNVCPPLARMTTGEETGVPPAECRLGMERARAIRLRLHTAFAAQGCGS